jgi:hypothetical protein
MAQMQICLAATYRKYYTRISPKTKDADMEVDDGVTGAGPIVTSLLATTNIKAHHCWMEFHDAKDM